MEYTDSIRRTLLGLLVIGVVSTVLGVFIFYHVRFLIDSINNQALGSGRLLWFLFLFFCPPFADVLYWGAVWSKRPRRIRDGTS